MKSSKKVTKSGGPKKQPGTSPGKKQNQLIDPKESTRLIIDEDEEDFEIQLDDDIKVFDDFDTDDDDDDF